jgi:hypothetical protein
MRLLSFFFMVSVDLIICELKITTSQFLINGVMLDVLLLDWNVLKILLLIGNVFISLSNLKKLLFSVEK